MIPGLGIGNARDLPIDDVPSTPSVASTLLGWFKRLELIQIVKTVVDYKTVEVEKPLVTSGIIQPFTEEDLSILPEGERSWRWHMIHATPDLALATDDVVEFGGEKSRVMGKLDYSDQGFVQYRVVNDYDRNGGGR